MKGHKYNKILTKKEILDLGNKEIERLLSESPVESHVALLRFHNKASKIDSWMSKQMMRSH